METPRPRRAVTRWVVGVGIAEGAGFAIAAGTAIIAIICDIGQPAAFAVTVTGGALEGAVLGSGQWLAMAGRRPPALRWILATALGAAIAWSIGLLPSTLGLAFTTPQSYLALALGAAVLLASIPVLQWLALARQAAKRWIPVNMGAWAVAVLWTIAPSPIIDERSPIWLIATLYVVAGALMAVTVAALTARTASRLFSAG